MSQPILHAMTSTLLLGLDEVLPQLPEQPRTAFLRAVYAADLRDYSLSPSWEYEQSFAPYADILRDAGLPVQSVLALEQGSYDCVLYLATRMADENLFNFARAWQALRVGGYLVVAQHNDLGAKRLTKLLGALDENLTSISKHHCRAVILQKQDSHLDIVSEWLNAGGDIPVAGEAALLTVAGIFSAGKVDEGSRLLVSALPKHLSGNGADIAAGWGYLSCKLFEKCPSISHITLVEAEKRALTMAERNLAPHIGRTRFLWADAAKPLDISGLDWIVMNPPMHDLLWSAPETTAAMFAEAHKTLRAGGTLWLVANSHLPYERTLESIFSRVQMVTHNLDYKVLEAVK